MVVKKTKTKLGKSKRTKKRSQVGGLKNKPPMPGTNVKHNIFLPKNSSFTKHQKNSSPININLFEYTKQTPFKQTTHNPLKVIGRRFKNYNVRKQLFNRITNKSSNYTNLSFKKPNKVRQLISNSLFKPPEPYKRPQSEFNNNKIEENALKTIRFHQGTNEITTNYVPISPLLRNTKSNEEPYNSNPIVRPKFKRSVYSTDKNDYTIMSAPNKSVYENMSNGKLTTQQVNNIQGYIEVNPDKNN